jgi:hypothetical protein
MVVRRFLNPSRQVVLDGIDLVKPSAGGLKLSMATIRRFISCRSIYNCIFVELFVTQQKAGRCTQISGSLPTVYHQLSVS